MFDVKWMPAAEHDLAAIWLGARDRQRVTEVAVRIEHRLAHAPESAGESREPGVRLMFDDPLWVEFEIDEFHRIVKILTVWRHGR